MVQINNVHKYPIPHIISPDVRDWERVSMRDGNDINHRASLHIPKAGSPKLNICCRLWDFTQQNRVGGTNYSPEPEDSVISAQVKVHKLPPQVEFTTTATIRSIKRSFVKIAASLNHPVWVISCFFFVFFLDSASCRLCCPICQHSWIFLWSV